MNAAWMEPVPERDGDESEKRDGDALDLVGAHHADESVREGRRQRAGEASRAQVHA